MGKPFAQGGVLIQIQISEFVSGFKEAIGQDSLFALEVWHFPLPTLHCARSTAQSGACAWGQDQALSAR
jgi:hypothetical protein